MCCTVRRPLNEAKNLCVLRFCFGSWFRSLERFVSSIRREQIRSQNMHVPFTFCSLHPRSHFCATCLPWISFRGLSAGNVVYTQRTISLKSVRFWPFLSFFVRIEIYLVRSSYMVKLTWSTLFGRGQGEGWKQNFYSVESLWFFRSIPSCSGSIYVCDCKNWQGAKMQCWKSRKNL